MSSDGSFSDCSGGDYDDGSGGDDGWISEDGGGWISEDGDHQDSSDQQEGSEVEEGIDDSRIQSSSDQEQADEGENSDQETDENSDHEGAEEDEDHGGVEESQDNRDSENYEESVHSDSKGTDEEEVLYHSATNSEDMEDSEKEDILALERLWSEFGTSENCDDELEDQERSEWSTYYCEYYQRHDGGYMEHFLDDSTDDEFEEAEERDYDHTDFFPSDEDSYTNLRHHSASPVRVQHFMVILTAKSEVQGETESASEDEGARQPVDTSSVEPKGNLRESARAATIGTIEGFVSDLVEIEYLGAGNFGQVFKMSGVKNGKRTFFAEKRMSTTDPLAKSEQKMLESISHRHIISYIQSYIKDNQLIVLMEFADHGTLTKMVEDASGNPSKGGLFEEHNIWRFINHMSSALDYLHISNILHRDLKVLSLK